jgi:thioredoxin 1
MLVLDSSNFNKEKDQNSILFVDFWSPSCRPCVMLATTLASLEEEYVDEVKFAKINCDSNVELAFEYNVNALPTLILFKNGKEIDRFLGLKSADFIRDFLNKNRG